MGWSSGYCTLFLWVADICIPCASTCSRLWLDHLTLRAATSHRHVVYRVTIRGGVMHAHIHTLSADEG